MKNAFRVVVVLASLVLGCGGGESEQAVDMGTQDVDLVAEIASDVSAPEVAAEDLRGVDEGTDDVVAGPFPLPELTEPVSLRAAFAGGLMPIPLGTAICGFAPGSATPSPYTDTFPGTKHLFQHPTIRLVVMEGGLERLIFLRLDLIGVNPDFLRRVEADLSEVTGYDWRGRVIANASHTHSSTGRLGHGAIWGFMSDTFFPALFDRMVATTVAMAADALTRMEPARFGYGMIETDAIHDDRRCENPDVQDDRLHLFRFDRADETPMGLVMVHSVHGTILDADERHVSRDAVGGIEDKVKESFDGDVEVFFFQAGAGDMSPDSPPVDNEDPLPEIDSHYSRIEALGVVAADVVESAFWAIETSDDIALRSISFQVPLGRDVMGYEDGEFPYEGGGAYCGSTVDAECWSGEPAPIEDLDKMCLDIIILAQGLGIEETAPDRTVLTAAMLGDVLVVTFPGEPVTQCLLNVEEGIRAEFPEQETIVVLGYSQDYVGYSTPEWDFYQGGYEASGAIYGPKQGDYLTQRAIDVARALLDGSGEVPFDDPGRPDLVETAGATFEVMVAKDAGVVVTEPEAKVAAGETVVFEFNGGSPWLLVPDVLLEKEVDGTFEPVTRANGSVVDSGGYEYAIEVLPEPTYEEVAETKTRTFLWRFELPTDRRVPAAHFPLSGTYRFHATGTALPPGALVPESYDLTSAPFVVE